eukprot:7583643-Pyramimonas_sp.AAC.1
MHHVDDSNIKTIVRLALWRNLPNEEHLHIFELNVRRIKLVEDTFARRQVHAHIHEVWLLGHDFLGKRVQLDGIAKALQDRRIEDLLLDANDWALQTHGLCVTAGVHAQLMHDVRDAEELVLGLGDGLGLC